MKKERILRKGIAAALAGILSVTAVPMGIGITSDAADEGYVQEAALSDKGTAAPTADEVVPDSNQYQYQKEELAAFCHFGPNTFNGVEWGDSYGDRQPSDLFTLRQDFDEDTLISTLKAAGFEKIIVTAKHHDGFCIWDSAYTEYDVAASGYQDANGNSDILAEISVACSKYDMDMGLYLSPWDIHEPSYGYYDENGNATDAANDALDYNDYYNNQLQEILGNDKYGNKGHFTEVWMDGAKGNGADAQEYDFERWFTTIQNNEGKAAGYDADCMLFGAQAYTTVRWIGNEDGYAYEETWAKSNVNKTSNSIDSNDIGSYTIGFEDGNQWTVPECDARITSGWFWWTNRCTPKSIADLANIYFNSVGHNSTLLLNVPPNNQGNVDQAILNRVTEFGNEISETFRTNLAENGEILASEVRGNDIAFKQSNVIDGNDDTYWTTNDGTTEGSLIIKLGETKTFDVVSIEEAIQFGQRITSFKVEYRNGDSDSWKTFDEGTTIGSKRLCRKSPVKADAVKITVSTSSDVISTPNVPMLSEVGVYKASAGFELASAAPEGMDVIDITDSAFSFAGSWTGETGAQFVNGTNKWSNGNPDGSISTTLSFTGTKVYMIGTIDPNHGTADIYIDNNKVASINTNGSARALSQILYESDTLTDGNHTLKLVATQSGKAIGLEAAYVINNGGLGMIGLENSQYTMNEDSTMNVKLIRTGGTIGSVSVTVSPNPGSAIQDDYDTENIVTVTFAEGETEKTVPVITRRNTNQTGDRYFTIEVTSDNEDLILGMNSKARVTIIDTESIPEDPDNFQYSAQKPFAFPSVEGTSATLEAEYMVLNNTGTNEAWPMQITEAAWASNGKFVNAMNSGDTAILYYNAEKAGTYAVTLTLRSGDTKNGLTWEENDGKIASGSALNIGASDSAGATHTAMMTFEVKEAGAGVLTFTAPQYNAPQLDKFEIELTKAAPEPIVVDKSALRAKVEEAEKLAEEDYTSETWTPFKKALEAAKAVRDNDDATQEQVDSALSSLTEKQNSLEEKQEPPQPIDDPELPYLDVKENEWFYPYVADTYFRGLMTGLDTTVFGPAENLARAQFAVILYRMEGSPEVTFTQKFPDVPAGQFYSAAVTWAVDNGIVTGFTDTNTFRPAEKITREQMAVMMYRYAKYKGMDVSNTKDLAEFPDYYKVSGYAVDAMEWCTAEEIIKGDGTTKELMPQGNTNRAECATIISRYVSFSEK